MDEAIQSLIAAYKAFKEISADTPGLLQYLKKYVSAAQQTPDRARTRQRLQKRNALHIFKSLSPTDLNYKYAEFVLSVRLKEAFGFYIKALALGFDVPRQGHVLYTTIAGWKSVYLALKSSRELNLPYHACFFEYVKRALLEYEDHVVRSSTDPLAFFAAVRPSYLKLDLLHQLNANFDAEALFRRPFSELGLNVKSQLNANIKEFIRGTSRLWVLSCLEAEDIALIKRVSRCLALVAEFLKWGCTVHLQQSACPLLGCGCPYAKACSESTRSEGEQQHGVCCLESKGSLYMSSITEVQKYVGTSKEMGCTCGSICAAFYREIDRLDVDEDLTQRLLVLQTTVAAHMMPVLHCIGSIILFLKKTFLFSRSDFVQCMFSLLRDLPLTRHSFVFVLDSSLDKTLQSPLLGKQIDIVILDSQDQWSHFTLFFKMEYPLSVLMAKEDRVWLSQIFKHLWRMKTVENLLVTIRMRKLNMSEKLRAMAYLDFVFRLDFYIFYEVIEKEYKRYFGDGKLFGIRDVDDIVALVQCSDVNPLEGLGTRCREFLSVVRTRIFMDRSTRTLFLNVLDELEKMCKDIAKFCAWNDDAVRYLKVSRLVQE
ncbi:UNVERIFIED_CONTAM: hypothetical protein PYX00_011484 [Menopon gallinae]|uniref:Gamma tubulin complex component C-terminal domain-containing protein n=1 Tax=Menopon gallinae TaxID=328185 RepID=A0AAW2H7J5_9NEOP